MTGAQITANGYFLLVVIAVGVITIFAVVIYQLAQIRTKLDLILRKLNNSQPDDEGGY